MTNSKTASKKHKCITALSLSEYTVTHCIKSREKCEYKAVKMQPVQHKTPKNTNHRQHTAHD